MLTCLLTSALPRALPHAHPIALTIRTSAASLLHLLLDRHAAAYPSLRPRVTKTLLRGLGGEGRGLGARWGAARGLSGLVSAEGGNKAVREWVGAGLKSLGELMEREEEMDEGERQETVREVLVRLFVPPSLVLWGCWLTGRANVHTQTVLKSSLLPADDDAEPALPDERDLHERFGPLFGAAIAERWERGGREIAAAVPGAVGGDDDMEE